MAKQAIKVQDIGVIDYVAGSDIAVGDVVPLGTTAIGIAQTAIANGETGVIVTAGVFDITAETGVAWSIGDVIYWDDTANRGTKTATSNARAGVAVAAKASAAAVGRISLNYCL